MNRAYFFTALIVWGALFSSISFGFSGWVTGKTGNALSFDGLDDFVEVPEYYGIGGSSARTVSLWIKTSATATSQGLVQWGSDAEGQLWYLRVESDGRVFVSAYAAGVMSSRIVIDNQWHHIAAVLDEGQTDPTQIRLYIDGQLDAVPIGSGTINTTQDVAVHLGGWYRPNVSSISNYFSGVMDEVCIYGRALDAGEIDPEAPIPTEGLVARWAMDETNGTVAHDSVSSYDGILKNMPTGYSGGTGTSLDPYKIATKADLLALAGTPAHYSKYFILTADIDLEGQVFTKAIISPDTDNLTINFNGTAFTGVFDGHGHRITSFTINGGGNDYLGLFGYIGQSGQVKYLGLEDYIINGISGGSYLGSLAGVSTGTVSQCYSTGDVQGYESVGGLAGANGGTIEQCYSTADVLGSNFVGGLVGNNSGSINQCYSTGPVSARISNYYSYIGGLVGYGDSGIVKDSFWDIQTSGREYSNGGGTGKTTAEMKTIATYAGVGWVSGMSGNGLYFDGKTGHVKIPDYYGVGGSSARTVSLWIKPVFNDQIQTLVQWGADTTGQLWMLRLLSDGTVQLAAFGGGVQSSKPITYNQWHQIVVLLPEGQTDSGKICLYIDGQSQTVALADHCTINTSQTVPVYLGAWYKYSTGTLLNYFKGMMDDVCIYGRALDGTEIVPVHYATGLVNRWKLDESSGVTANDSVGSQNGTLHHMAIGGWVAGKTGNALAFNGTTSYAESSSYRGISGTHARTVSLWIKTSNVGTPQALVQWGSDAAGQLWYLRVQTDGTVFASTYGAGVTSSQIIADDKWHHVAAVLDEGQTDPTRIRLYIDGQLDAVPTGTGTMNTTEDVAVHLGAWYRPNAGGLSDYFNGLMDDVCIYNRALETSEIASDVISEDGLVTHWKLDESEGTVAYDSAGGHDGQVYHANGGNWAFGRAGNALTFDGIDDYVDVPEHYGIGGTGARTVGVWVKTAAKAQPQTLIQWGSDLDGQLWMLRVEADGTVLASAYHGGVQSIKTITDNQWHYVAAVLDEGQTDSSRIRLYIDGQLDAKVNGLSVINTAQAVPVHIGVWHSYRTGGKTNYFQGLMDDICIYDRALDGHEIAPVNYTTGLVNHWKLDESQGTTANDSAGTQQGVLHNMTDENWVYGRTGKALAFSGTNAYVNMPDHFGIGGTSARTVSVWVKTTSAGTMVQWGADTIGQMWLMRILSTGVVQVAAFGGGVNGAAVVTDGQWHHIAAMLDEGQADSSKIRLYIDGKPDAIATALCTINTAQTVPVHLGAWYMASTGSLTGYFSGLIDDVCIYNRAIEINEIYPENEYPVSAEGLVSRWRMDETEGAIVHDVMSSHNGTLNSTGWDFVPSWIDGDSQDWILSSNEMEYPKLRWQYPSTYSGGSGTADDPYQIADSNDILLLADAWWDWGKHFIMTSDIDMGGMLFTNAIIAMNINVSSKQNAPFAGTAFTGMFDGNSHTLSHFTINGSTHDYLGMFGYIGSTGQINNLGLENCTVSGTSSSYYAGSLAGYNAGVISRCYSKGAVSGDYYVGGLVGGNGGEVNNSYSTGSVTGYVVVGGLSGINSSRGGTLAYNDYDGYIFKCYSTGTVNGSYNFGGLVGVSLQGALPPYSNRILNSFWDMQTSGQTTSAGGTGKTTAEMKTLLTFTLTDWDFVREAANGMADIWRMCNDGVNYPKLTWQHTGRGDFDCPDGVSTEDLLRLGQDWLLTYTAALYGADATGDKSVNLVDFAILAEHWLDANNPSGPMDHLPLKKEEELCGYYGQSGREDL